MSHIEIFIFSTLFLGLFTTLFYTIKMMNGLDEIVDRLKKHATPIKKITKTSSASLKNLDNFPKNKT
jgi:hypothetical protein